MPRKSRWRSRSHTGFNSGRDFDIAVPMFDMHGTGQVAEAYHKYVEARVEQLMQQHWKQTL